MFLVVLLVWYVLCKSVVQKVWRTWWRSKEATECRLLLKTNWCLLFCIKVLFRKSEGPYHHQLFHPSILRLLPSPWSQEAAEWRSLLETDLKVAGELIFSRGHHNYGSYDYENGYSIRVWCLWIFGVHNPYSQSKRLSSLFCAFIRLFLSILFIIIINLF